MVARKARIAVIGAGMAGLAAANHLHTGASPDLFDLAVFEAGDRIGGRFLTSDFAGDRAEMGATWIHGINGSPVYAMAVEQNLMEEEEECNWERMDGFPTDRLMVAEGGFVVDEEDDVSHPISALFNRLMDDARRAGNAVPADGDSTIGAYLKRGFQQYQSTRTATTGGGFGDGKKWSVEALEESLFAMKECMQRTVTAADDLADLNLAAESEYADFSGEHVTIAKGYSRVAEHLASELPPGTVRLGQRLSKVEWNSSDGARPVRLHFAGGGIVEADHVIVTVSLGVLKAGIGKRNESGDNGIEFDPPLPDFKRDAIGRLGWGVVDKLFMELTETENLTPFPFLRMAFHQDREEESLERQLTGHVSKIPWWIRKTESICPIFNGSRVLLAWFAGKEAAHLESLDDKEIINGVNATLNGFLPESGYRVANIKRSGWASDPLFLGSYSYVSAASSGEDFDRMAEPLPRLQVLFAGEATHRRHYSTTHGAYLSGIREAQRLLKFYHVQCC